MGWDHKKDTVPVWYGTLEVTQEMMDASKESDQSWLIGDEWEFKAIGDIHWAAVSVPDRDFELYRMVNDDNNKRVCSCSDCQPHRLVGLEEQLRQAEAERRKSKPDMPLYGALRSVYGRVDIEATIKYKEPSLLQQQINALRAALKAGTLKRIPAITPSAAELGSDEAAPTAAAPVCECGVDKAGCGKHSDYCPKFIKE